MLVLGYFLNLQVGWSHTWYPAGCSLFSIGNISLFFSLLLMFGTSIVTLDGNNPIGNVLPIYRRLKMLTVSSQVSSKSQRLKPGGLPILIVTTRI